MSGPVSIRKRWRDAKCNIPWTKCKSYSPAKLAHQLELRMFHKTPCGSSSGSAIGVAAGFAPISVGSECDGSIVQPACRAALYGMKATPGTIPGDGAFATSRAFDSHGGMAKTPNDLAEIMGLLMNGTDFTSSLKSSWEGIGVGFVDWNLWQPASFVVEDNEDFREQTVRKSICSFPVTKEQVNFM